MKRCPRRRNSVDCMEKIDGLGKRLLSLQNLIVKLHSRRGGRTEIHHLYDGDAILRFYFVGRFVHFRTSTIETPL